MNEARTPNSAGGSSRPPTRNLHSNESFGMRSLHSPLSGALTDRIQSAPSSQHGETEMQLQELYRRYRIMEGNRKSYSEDSQAVIRRQRAAIEKLKSDNSALKQELEMLFASQEGAAATLNVQQEMARLQDQADQYTRKLEVERRKLEEMDKAIADMSTKAFDTRKMMGGVNAGKENMVAIQKQVKVLDNRLEKALVKFNEALAHNKSLRDGIDSLRRERVVFDTIYKKMERELHEKKKEMANVIEISNIAYEARDQAQNEIAALKAQADKEQAAFEAEWRELGKLIEQSQRTREFGRYSKINRGGQGLGPDEDGKRKKSAKGSWALARDKQSIKQMQVTTYEEAFQRIHEATGIDDIDELVTMFISTEDKNFSLFNYVNELNQEMEKLEEVLAETRAEIERYRGQGQNTDHQRKKIIKDLEDKLARTEQRCEQYETRYQKTMRTITALKAQLMSIFNRTGCNTPAVREMLGEGSMTEANMLQYLGIIEQRTNEILQIYAIHQARLRGAANEGMAMMFADPRLALAHGPSTPAGGTHISVDPPSTSEDYASEDESDEDFEDRPMTREELEERTIRRLQKREVNGRYKPTRGIRKK